MLTKIERLWFSNWKKKSQDLNQAMQSWKNSLKSVRKNGNNSKTKSKKKVCLCLNRMLKLVRVRNEPMDWKCSKAQRFSTVVDWLPANDGVRWRLERNVWSALFRCLSCYSELNAGTLCTYLPCAHLFHKECIGNHLKVNKHCPACQ